MQPRVLRTHDDVVLRNEALLERLGLGVHHHLAARQPLAHVVVRVSLHLGRIAKTMRNRAEKRVGCGQVTRDNEDTGNNQKKSCPRALRVHPFLQS